VISLLRSERVGDGAQRVLKALVVVCRKAVLQASQSLIGNVEKDILGLVQEQQLVLLVVEQIRMLSGVGLCN
jgi:hypothetical protein